MKTVVAVPTYNEMECLEPIINRLRMAVPDADIVVVDDNSPDGTGELADRIATQDSHVHVLHRKTKDGLGRAYLFAFAWALAAGYEVIVECDADGSHDPAELPKLLHEINRGADLVIGARWIKGGAVENWPLHRQLLSRLGNIYVSLMLNLKIADATAGFRAYRADLLRKIKLNEVDSSGFCFQIDMTRRARGAGAKIVEVPILFHQRFAGESKINSMIIIEALAQVTRWGITSSRNNH